MIVYTCWQGQYEDRNMKAIFTKNEAAEEYIKRSKAINGKYNEMDDEPIEWEVDEFKTIPKYITFYCSKNYDYKAWLWHVIGDDEEYEYNKKFICKGFGYRYVVKVKFNYDRSVMDKDVQDKLNMLIARDEGI